MRSGSCILTEGCYTARRTSIEVAIYLATIGETGLLWRSCWSSRNDKSLIWSDPEGSSHSDGFMCRDVAGGTATQSLNWLFSLGLFLLYTQVVQTGDTSKCPKLLPICYFPDIPFGIFAWLFLRQSARYSVSVNFDCRLSVSERR